MEEKTSGAVKGKNSRPVRIIGVVLAILLAGLIGLGIGTWIGSNTGKNIGAVLGIGGPRMNTLQAWEPITPQDKAMELFAGNGTTSFAEFYVDDSFQSVQMGIDYFRNGELVKDDDQGTFNLRDDEAHPSEGMIGFLCRDAALTMGCSTDGLGSSVDHIDLPGYQDDGDRGLAYGGISAPRQIRSGEKIYIGMLTTGDSINTSALEHPGKDTLQGKS